ncbi:hypothetical protein ACIRT2_22475 [Pseudomonas aeruginosa]|uniref:head-tail joining protein n=1 Tax=Pseudomonas aeruginosa TaxID=287 RepID=UPI003D9C1C55|nr:hypothetical protein [Pseudomonas aeruginosa]
MRFHERFADLDALLFDELGDPAHFEGRAEPVLGEFTSPWQAPRMGTAPLPLREPRFTVLASDAASVEVGQGIVVDLPPPDGGAYIVVRREPDGTGLVALLLRRD